MLENSIAEKKNILKVEFKTTDGTRYKLTKFVNDKACVEKTGSEEANHFARFRLSTLDPNDKSKRLIKDQVFKDYTAIIKLRKVAIFVWSLLFLCCIGSIVAAIILKENFVLMATFIALAVLFFIGGSLVLSISIYWRIILKKRELRIN